MEQELGLYNINKDYMKYLHSIDYRVSVKYKLFTHKPSAPSYIDPNRISDLYFNPDKSLSCDYEHIIKDNIKRLPYDFIKSRTAFVPSAMALIQEYERTNNHGVLNKLLNLIISDSPDGEHLRRELQKGIEEAVETSKKYCRWNYKTAIPVYYSKSDSISLLLPLKLMPTLDSPVDVALVVERLENGNYQGQTIFTLAMAYQDARQICRPNSDWLVAHDIKSDN